MGLMIEKIHFVICYYRIRIACLSLPHFIALTTFGDPFIGFYAAHLPVPVEINPILCALGN